MTISTFDGATGQLKTQLATKSLGSKVKENTWYDLGVDTCEDPGVGFNVEFQFSDDTFECANPDTCIAFGGPLPAGIVVKGAAGVAGYAKNAFADSQVHVNQNGIFGHEFLPPE
jgi:hypothetical protein